jgi:O-antigen ligase
VKVTDDALVDRMTHRASFLGILIAIYYFLAPLEDALTISGNTIAKYFALGVCLLAVLQILDSRAKIHFDRIVGSLVYLALLSWVSLSWAENVGPARSAALTYSLLIGMFIVVYLLDLREADVRLIERSIVGGGLFCVIYMALGEGLGSILNQRLILTDSSDPNGLAALLALPGFLAIHKSLNTPHLASRVGYFLSALAIFIMIAATGSRGATLAIAAFFLIYSFMIAQAKGMRWFWILLGSAAVTFAVIVAIIPAELRERLFTLGGYTVDYLGQSEMTRSFIWQRVIGEVIPSMPVYGVGAGNAPDTVVPWYIERRGIHNLYLNMVVEYGLLGIPGLLVFIGTLIGRNKRRNDFFRVSALIAILVIAFFLDAFIKKYFWNSMMYAAIGLRTWKAALDMAEAKR